MKPKIGNYQTCVRRSREKIPVVAKRKKKDAKKIFKSKKPTRGNVPSSRLTGGIGCRD